MLEMDVTVTVKKNGDQDAEMEVSIAPKKNVMMEKIMVEKLALHNVK